MSDNINTDQFDNDIDFLVKTKQENVKLMTEEQLVATLPQSAQDYFRVHPEMIASFKAHAEGNHALSRQLSRDAVRSEESVVSLMGHLTEAVNMVMKLTDDPNSEQAKAFKLAAEKAISSLPSFEDPEDQLPPGAEEESELFEKDGVDLHLSAKEFEYLIRVMDDAHKVYVGFVEHGKKELAKDPTDSSTARTLEEGEQRHSNWHIVEKALFDQVAIKYPILGSGGNKETIH
jgi:hypothetical protein